MVMGKEMSSVFRNKIRSVVQIMQVGFNISFN